MGVAKVANNWASEASPTLGVQSTFRVIYITRKMVPITGRARSFLLVQKQNREEGETE